MVAFFCTSGFLITTNLLRRYGEVANVDLYAFYVMRFSRIVPPLVLFMAVLVWLSTTPIEAFHFAAPVTLRDVLLNLAKLRYNHYYQHAGRAMLVSSILWSLSIEEVFYLAYPLVAKLAWRAAALVVILVAVVAAGIIRRRGGAFTLYDYFGCFDAIALGALAALAAERFGRGVSRWAAWGVMLAGIALAGGTYAFVLVDQHHTISPTLIAGGTALILFACRCAPFVNTRPSPYDPLASVGRSSYEIYLFHMTIFALLGSVTTNRYPVLLFGFGILSAVTVSGVIARYYAEPLNRMLRGLLLTARSPRAARTVPVPSPAV